MTVTRVAALYDIHANLPALEAVLDDVLELEVDLIVIGGDVAWGPMPRETVRRLRSLPQRTAFVDGNADREIRERAGEETGLDQQVAELNRWCADQLDESDMSFLHSFRDTVAVDIAGIGGTLFCHGSPRSDDEIVTPMTDEALMVDMLAGVEEQTVVSGHTHVQFDRAVGSRRWINAGSVGLPYETTPGAYWALLDAEDVRLVSTSYDVDAAAAAIRATGYPLASDLARSLIDPDGPLEAATHFERMAGRT